MDFLKCVDSGAVIECHFHGHQWLKCGAVLEGTIKVIPALKCEEWGEI